MPRSYALLSTYPPTQCGLATFTAALLAHLPGTGDHAAVVRVLDGPAPSRPPAVVHDLVNGCPASAAAAVSVLNGFDVAIVQHEYGIYGGHDGEDILALLAALHVPSIAVLHTVLARPSPHQRMVLDEVIAAADSVVTMTRTARTRVLGMYGTSPAKVSVIPHGAADYRYAGAADCRPAGAAGYRHAGTPGRREPGRRGSGRRGSGRPCVLTWGLLGPGKGIEHAIDAIALLRDGGLAIDYVIAGRTHPRVQERDGEAYRSSLESRACARGVGDLVHFDARYLPAPALSRLIAAADVVLLPYESAEQVTSGVLIEAVTAGKPVVSTPFPHAVELLEPGPGLLVERKNPQATADALRRIFTEPGLATRMSAHAAAVAPTLLWPAVARSYRELASSLLTATPATAAL